MVNELTDHVILTRFNLPSTGVESLVRAQEGWLRARVDLFERYCLPSVRAQRSKNFAWLVYFDPESPGWLLDKVRHYASDGLMRPIYRSAVSSEELLSDLKDATQHEGRNLLTTNLDNDDGLAVDFVERLQRVQRTHDHEAVYFVSGLIKNGNRLYRRRDKRNAFCSVLESWEQPRTCWSEWHNLLGQTMPVVELGGAPGWLQVVHGTNVSNRVHGQLADAAPFTTLFPELLDDITAPGQFKLMRDRFLNQPWRHSNERARALLKRAVMGAMGKDGLDRVKLELAKRRGISR
jgi:hypothetical protein